MATLNKKGQREPSPGTAPLIILLVIAATVIFYVLTVEPGVREELIGPVHVPGIAETTLRTVLDVNPGMIESIPESRLTKYPHNLATFTIDNTPQPQTKALATQFLVKRSLTIDMPAEMSFVVADKAELTSASLELLVNDRKENGELVVTLNDKAIYNARVDAGDALTIVLPVDSITKGTNDIKIYAAGAGIKFWATNSYLLSDINLVTYSYTGENAAKAQTVVIPATELKGAMSAKLTAYAKQLSENSAKLTIRFNDAEIYGATPKTDAISVDIPASKLLGTNTLQWAVAKDGAYLIEFGKLTIITSKTSSKVKSYSFTLTSAEASNAAAGRLTCTLELTSPDRTKSVDVSVNGYVNTYYFDSGETEKDVCSYLNYGTNRVELSAAEDITINSMKLTIKGK